MRETKTTEIGASRRAFVFLVAAFLCFWSSNYSRVFGEAQTLETPFGAVKVDSSIASEKAARQGESTLRVVVEKPRALRLDENDVEGDYGDFDVEALADETRELDDERDVVTRTWKLYPKRDGQNELPPIPLRFVPKEGEKDAEPIVAILPAQTIAIEKNATTKSIDEIEPNLEPLRAFPTLWVLIGVATLVVVFALVRVLRTRAKVKPEETTVATPETPLEKALRELDALKISRVYLENRPEFYAQVVDVLRVYLKEEFKISAEEKTTQEILAAIDSTHSLECVLNITRELDDELRAAIGASTLKTPEIKRELEEALNSVDLVKFAKRETTFNDASAIYNSVRKVVENAASEFAANLKEVEERIERQNQALEAAKAAPNVGVETLDSSQNSQISVEKTN